MAKTLTPTITDAEYRTAAVAAEKLAFRAYDDAIGLSYYGVSLANEFFRTAEDCAAREDWVGCWLAYGGAYLAGQDNQRNTLIKRDEHGNIR